MPVQQHHCRLRRGKKGTRAPEPVMSSPGSAPPSSLGHLATRCVATDQSGSRVIVSPPIRQGLGSEKNTQLRFVLMRQAELEYAPKSHSRNSKKRTPNLSFPQDAVPAVRVRPLSPVNHAKLYPMNEVTVSKPSFAALTFHERMYTSELLVGKY